MNQLVPVSATMQLPVLVQAAGARAQTRFWEFFLSNIRNPQTRRAYACTLYEFFVGADPLGKLHLDIRAIQTCR